MDESRPSLLNSSSSPRQVTIVLAGSVVVVHPFLPADVAAKFVGMSCAATGDDTAAVAAAAAAAAADVGKPPQNPTAPPNDTARAALRETS